MSNKYDVEGTKIRLVIESVKAGTVDSGDVLYVIETLLKRMEFKQKTKMNVNAILDEHFSN